MREAPPIRPGGRASMSMSGQYAHDGSRGKRHRGSVLVDAAQAIRPEARVEVYGLLERELEAIRAEASTPRDVVSITGSAPGTESGRRSRMEWWSGGPEGRSARTG